MIKQTDIYCRLQRHLDNQAIGYPATKTGAEIRILKHIFTPEEAEIALYLTYRFQSLETIYAQCRHLVDSPEHLAAILDAIEKNGGIETKTRNGEKLYCNAPLVVGMFEFQLGRLTPEFIQDFDEYIGTRQFGLDFVSTKLPQMRTIPIAKSIQPQQNVSTFDEVAALLQDAEKPFAILECICRGKKEMKGGRCRVTDRKETCFAVGSAAAAFLNNGIGREIDSDEALAILEQNQKQGLVLQPSNTDSIDFICSCCGCCCGMLRMHKNLPVPVDFWASNFYAVVDADACDGCGICQKRCQVWAARSPKKAETAWIDLNRCIGCGVCIPTCPKGALSLRKKPAETVPPPTREALLDILKANKKGKLGKLRIVGKLVFDSIRTGQTHLLK